MVILGFVERRNKENESLGEKIMIVVGGRFVSEEYVEGRVCEE